jgi:protein TonB
MSQDPRTPKRPEDFVRFDLDESDWHWKDKRRPFSISLLVHVSVFLLLAVPITRNAIVGEPILPSEILVRFYEMGATGPGGGGGGGGSGGRRPSSYIRARLQVPKPEETPTKPRKAPVAPRRIPSINADSLTVPDLPADTDILFSGVFSPDAVDFPGLSLIDGKDYGGLDTEPSSGTGGGIGGGEGTGVGSGQGWGVGPGRGGGFGGGEYRPGAHDIEPTLIFKPPAPAYPPRAREKMITGEVILRIGVKLDGTTQVLGVMKSLPYCNEIAIENAKKWRWKPALKDGKPIETEGIITVHFDLFAPEKRKG